MRRPLAAAAVIATLAALPGAPAQNAGPVEQQNPAQVAYRVERVKTGLQRPWEIQFAPSGNLMFTSRDSGMLSSLDIASGAVTRLGTVAVRDEGEGGLLGMALDPQFAQNRVVYLCYSTSDGGAGNRLTRFVVGPDGLSDPKILVDDMPGANIHNGCRVTVGPDGKLYLSMGDAADQSLPQNPQSLGGKIMRVNTDGSIPADNPYPNSPIWTIGHRNPQGLAFQPGTGKLWSTEHGPSTNDELNVIEKGKNYGWPSCLGTASCSVANYRPAVKAYTPSSAVAMSDMVFYEGDAFPAWKGNLFFVTLKTGRLYRLVLDGERVASEQILVDNEYGRLRDVTVGPDGFIYLATDSEDAAIYRVRPR